MSDKIKLTDWNIVEVLRNFIDECDADVLALITGQVLGGSCSYEGQEKGENIYHFTPDENYMGAFDNIK